MKAAVMSLLLVLPIVLGCHRAKPAAPTTANKRGIAVADRGEPMIDRDAEPVPQRPANNFDRPPGPAMPPSAPHGHAVVPASARGTMVIPIYGTPLDFILDSLTIAGGEFQLKGQGVNYVGRMSNDWRGAVGRDIAIEVRTTQFGESAMDLPQIGTVKVSAGQIILDKVVGQNPARVKGRITLVLPGPDGPSSFAGTFEVGVVVK